MAKPKVAAAPDTSSKKNGTFVARCTKGCAHEFQDKQYSGLRLFNRTKSGGGRCTVCSNVQGA